LSADPYGSGWLFEGWEIPGRTRADLIGGDQAQAWLAVERERLTRTMDPAGAARLLPRTDVVSLFQQFFSRSDWAGEQ
jgi:hypothetical protein